MKVTNYLKAMCVLVLFAMTNANALTFTETTDFSNALSPFESSVGTLDVGQNFIFGSLAGFCTQNVGVGMINCNSTLDDNQDSPTYIVANGMQVDSIEFSFTNFVGPEGVRAGLSAWQNVTGFVWNSLGQADYEPTEGDFLLVENLGLPAGLYGLNIYGQDSLESGEYFFDYAVTITVSQVPIPAAYLLFSCGLLVLGRFYTRTQ